MALLGRILLFILLLLLIITVGASLYAKPQFFAKELTDIPARDGRYLSRLCVRLIAGMSQYRIAVL